MTMTTSRRVERLLAKATEQAEQHAVVADQAVIYIRVSTEEQAATGFGLESQERAARAFAESQGYELVEVVTDRAVSGATLPARRKGFKRVVELAEAKMFSVLIVWKFDRLARDLGFAVTTVNDLRTKYGIALRSVTEPIDTATPMGEVMFAILAGMAGQERRSITERTHAGRESKAAHGGFAGGEAPLGYTRDKEGGIVPVEAEAQTVRRIFAMRAAGSSLRAIADTLTAEGASTKRGGRWHAATVSYVLDNPKYHGRIEYLFSRDGQRTHVSQQGRHQALIEAA
jgi:site-specific DNA recombinase